MAAQQERLREAYNELKYTAPDKVEAMRDQEMTRMQMNLAYRTGTCLHFFLFRLVSTTSMSAPLWHALQPSGHRLP
jgi:hypothetical protein